MLALYYLQKLSYVESYIRFGGVNSLAEKKSMLYTQEKWMPRVLREFKKSLCKKYDV